MACQYFAPCDHGATSFTIAIPKVTFGRGTLSEVGMRAQSLGIAFQIFSDIRVEPDDFCVEQGAALINSGKFDGMISVGGGSVIDTAKAAVVCAKRHSPLMPFFAKPIGESKPVTEKLLPHIACPTTSGTGSECCDTLPTNVIASTGFDLLSHALECYTAKAYTQWAPVENPNASPMLQGANPWSDLAATKALQIAGTYLDRAVNDTSDQQGAGLEDAGEVLSKRMIELMQQTRMPNGLSGVGFGSADIKAMAASSVRQARAIANAPRESNLVDLENIYADAISYW